MKAGDRVILTEPLIVIDPDCYDDAAEGGMPVAETETECGHIMPDLYARKFTPVTGESLRLWGEYDKDGNMIAAWPHEPESIGGSVIHELIAFRKAGEA